MKRQIAFILVMFAVFAVGCTEYTLATDEQREIDVCLNFNTVRPESSTKASADVTSLESTDVKDLWVLQFNGTSASSGLLMARYYPDYAPGTKVKLLTSDVENYLLFVANSHNPSIEFGKGRTLDEVKDIRIAILTDTEAAGELHSGRYDMIMNGHVQTVVSGASLSLDVPLKRNAVRLNFKVTNTTGGTENPITIDSLRLRSGTAYMSYYTDYELPDYYPAKSAVSPVSYPSTAWNDGLEDGSARRFTFYCPANKKGTVPTDDPKQKLLLAPSGVTYLQVMGTDSQGRRVAYKFALGSDLVTDCNLLPNTDYSYDIIISSPGDYVTDSRVENLYMQDFTDKPLANSYMIQPPTVEGVWKHVRIPVKRIYDFWNITDGYERVSGNALDAGSFGWRAEILKSTVELVEDVNFKWIKRDGVDYRDYFEFAIAAGLEGNFMLGVHRFTDVGRTLLDDVFLWSWHMWVTDYNPDATLPLLTPQVDGNGYETCYAYDVAGGQVNRYYGNLWKVGGVLEGRFMMDRNLGELSVDKNAATDILTYQWGRKDPFPYESSNNNSLHKTLTTYNRYNDGSAFPYRTQAQLTEENVTDGVVYSVYHPDTYIAIFGNWMLQDRNADNILYNAAYSWNDPRLGTGKTIDYNSKSIFDPCPAGWRVPPQGAIEFPANTKNSTNSLVHKRILPNGVVMRYPVTGVNNGLGNGTVQYNVNNSWGFWSNRANNINNAYSLFGNGTNVNQMSANPAKGVGMPVRCVSYTEE